MGYVCKQAIEQIFELFPQDACYVCANGYISREAYNVDDRPNNFYMLGSMGLGPSIALGAAMTLPDKKVVVLDGDGNLIMGMGALCAVGHYKPKNMIHICLDNGVYASTGNQPTVARSTSLEGVAKACGYTHVATADSPETVATELKKLLEVDGPSFLRILIDPEGHPRTFDRVSHSCAEIHGRFAGALKG